MNSHRRLIVSAMLLAAALVAPARAEELDPGTLTKYLDPLPVPAVLTGSTYYEIGAWQIQQQLHSQLPLTTVYGYGTSQATASYPGPSLVVQRGVPVSIRWTNHLQPPHLLDYAFDPTLPYAVSSGIPITTHVHGAEVEPQSDGGPMTWFTADFAETGPDFAGEVKTYANTQLPATIWYHDHAFGFTRHNVYAGLAGFYLVTDPATEPQGLPSGPYDLGVCIQDKMLTTDGQLWYPNEGESEIHPVWIPEFFGDIILVNGKAWPYLEVEPRKYRFRFLNGAQARFFSLALAERLTSAPGPAFHQIGSDGGYLAEAVVLNDPGVPTSPRLVMAPGERADVIVDFSGYAAGTELLLKNTAKAPFPNGEAADPQTVGQIMLFRVIAATGPDPSVIPSPLATVTRLTDPTVTRVMTLNEQMVGDAPVSAMLNGMPFDAPETETPVLGTTEMWEIVNMTGDSHPIHIHLVQFQLLNRQRVNVRRYERAFEEANPEMPAMTYVPVAVDPYLKGKPVPADANERGWKDTFRMNPGEVTRILVRFAPQDDTPAFAFDATAEPGYVWHCHILEHEENDMMRPFHLVAPLAGQTASLGVARGEGSGALVTPVRLWNPQPNPTTAGATLRFALREAGSADVDVYSVAGQRVRRLASGWFPAGEHTVAWDGLDADGGRLPRGMYFVNLRAGGVSETRKVLLTP